MTIKGMDSPLTRTHPVITDRVEVVPDTPEPVLALQMSETYTQLAKLREQFPPERIEKLPKPKWKGAWDDFKGSNCPECGGYHVIQNCIHLDYVGHANVTDRLLEVDPLWSWEPMALTEAGTPLFSDGGMWIKLTICGVTRIGYGDGKSVKEVIGDAIRNAAMRFGVGLDLWAKISLHEERNPGDGQAPARRTESRPAQSAPDRTRARSNAPQEAPQRAGNQDALDALQSVCDEHGYSTQYCIDRFFSDHDKHIRLGTSEEILLLAEQLADEATAEPDGDGPISGVEETGGGEEGGADEEVAHAAGSDGRTDGGASSGGIRTVERPVSDDPNDTSDVEPQEGDIF